MQCTSGRSTVVKHSYHHLKDKSSNPAAADNTGGERANVSSGLSSFCLSEVSLLHFALKTIVLNDFCSNGICPKDFFFPEMNEIVKIKRSTDPWPLL